MPLSTAVTSRLQNQHEVISDLIRGLSEEQLRQRVIPEKWSAYEQLVHLTTYQPVFYQRLRRIEQEEQPQFEPYAADMDAAFHDCLQLSLKEVTEDFSTQRFILINHLVALPDTALRRTGIHPVYGVFTIPDWTEMFLLHESHHLWNIFQLTSRTRATVKPF